MKRSKDGDKDDAVASTVAVANNNNNSKMSNNNTNASPNISSSSSNDANNANGGTPGTAGTVRTTGRVKKPKQVYDPSDNYISRGSRNSLPAPTQTLAPAPSPSSATVPASTAASASQAAPQSATPAQNSSLSTQQQQQPQQQTSNINTNEISSVGEESADANSIAMPSAEQLRNYDTCIKCSKSEPKRGSGYKSNYLACKACTLKWHFSCLPITFEILTNARKRYKCEDCRRCRLCVSNKADDKLKGLVMCCVCVNVYHLECHWPHVLPNKLTDPNWKCYSCDPSYNALHTDDDVAQIESESLPRKSKAGRKKRATSDPAPANAKKMAIAKQLITKNGNTDADDFNTDGKPVALCNTSVVPNQESEMTKSTDEEIEESPKSLAQSPQSTTATNDFVPPPIPKEDKENENGAVRQTVVAEMPQGFQKPVQTWNVDQVVSYVEKFYPQESNIFKVQEIDGAALMVLTRQDIIDRFGLKLGPALRLYELILSLQSSRDDVTLGWCD
ncbi:hypothetical protein ACLKA7_007406 [Drosophila subpalustris]